MDIPAVSVGDVLRRIVIRIHLIPTIHTLERLVVTVVLVRKSTVRTPLTRVRRIHEVHEQRGGFNLVLHKFHELRVNPLLELLPVRDVLADMVEVFKNNTVHIHVVGFRDEVVRSVVQPVQRPIREPTSDGLNREVR